MSNLNPKVKGRLLKPTTDLTFYPDEMKIRIDDSKDLPFWLELQFTKDQLEDYLVKIEEQTEEECDPFLSHGLDFMRLQMSICRRFLLSIKESKSISSKQKEIVQSLIVQFSEIRKQIKEMKNE